MNNSVENRSGLLIDKEGELRCGWRILIFYVLLSICFILVSQLVALLSLLIPAITDLLVEPSPTQPATVSALVSTALTRGLLLASGLAASALCARLLERRTLGSVGYRLHKGWLRDFALGSVLGFSTIAIGVGIIAAGGSVDFTFQPKSSTSILQNLAGLFCVLLIASAFEEIVIHGFAFQALDHNLGPAIAVGITSVAFGLIHFSNPQVTPFAVINTVLAGVWLGLAYLKTRSLWLATALHFSWNLAMAFIFGLPISGITMYQDLALLKGESETRVWLSGGEYGPEGGAAATLALLGSTMLIWRTALFFASDEMKAAIEHGAREKRRVLSDEACPE